MQEEFLQFVWRHRLFDASDLKTTGGLSVEVLKQGQLNAHAGPDFFDARIRLDGTLWAGNVEIHTVSSEWHRHGHTHDQAYANTILHVVYQHDEELERPGTSSQIPTLTLKDRIDYQHLRRYKAIKAAKKWIPCQEFAPDVPAVHWRFWLERMAIERLEQRYEVILRINRNNHNDFLQTAFGFILRYFGLRTNGPVFEQLANHVPFKLVQQIRSHRTQVEALLYGQAGFLKEAPRDEYQQRLTEEYAFLCSKHKLEAMHPTVWKFARMRPNNFPTVRLAQIAGLFVNNTNPVSALLEAKSPKEAISILSNSEPSAYWRQHYRFGKISKKPVGAIGHQTAQIIIINAIVPLRFALGKLKGQESLCDDAVNWWRQQPPERNSVIKKWESLGVKPSDSADSQALLYLKRNYCTPKKCLHCNIGNRIIQKPLTNDPENTRLF